MKIFILNTVTLLIVLGISPSLMSEELNLNRAIDLALAYAPEIKIASSELRAQESKQISSWLDLGPRLSATFNGAWHDGKQSFKLGERELLIKDDRTALGTIKLTQPLSGLFALTQNARIESKQKSVKELNLQLLQSQTAFKIAQLYLNVQQAHKMWEVSKSSLEGRLAQKKDGELLLQAGRIHYGDFLKLDLAVSQARSSEAQATAEKNSAFYSLIELIGHQDPQSIELSSFEIPPDISESELPSLSECLSIAFPNRIEKMQSLKGREIASIARTAAFAKFFPEINFFAQIDKNFGTPSMGAKESSKMLGLNLSWNFWNNGSDLFSARQAQEQFFKSNYQEQLVDQKIKLELINVLSSLKSSRQSYRFAQKSIEQADESYRIENLKFKTGKSSATELILAEAAKTNAHAQIVVAYTELKLREFKLQQALGKNRPEL
ncbi:MAG: TolC family protein [Myxococcales bacterium]|nr:TolC family protein [Myxococcales bacterium]USN51833.1 MAG: TolC family protein [Myxococcales bacterium]